MYNLGEDASYPRQQEPGGPRQRPGTTSQRVDDIRIAQLKNGDHFLAMKSTQLLSEPAVRVTWQCLRPERSSCVALALPVSPLHHSLALSPVRSRDMVLVESGRSQLLKYQTGQRVRVPPTTVL